MSSTDDRNTEVRLLGKQEVALMRKEMEAHRLAMLDSLEVSKARFKALLRGNRQQHPEASPLPDEEPPAPKPPV
jgi:glutaredoxin 2